jgi:hypothetical protein
MKTAEEIVDAEIPRQGFFTYKELGEISPYSPAWWAKRARSGRIRVIQSTPGQQGSTVVVPRGEVIRELAECIR